MGNTAGLVWANDDVVLPARSGVEEVGHGPARLIKTLLPAETALLFVDIRVRDIERLNADTREDVDHFQCFRYSERVILLHVEAIVLRTLPHQASPYCSISLSASSASAVRPVLTAKNRPRRTIAVVIT